METRSEAGEYALERFKFNSAQLLTDEQAVEPIHEALFEKTLLPKEHLMDSGYTAAEYLVNSKTDYDVEIIGPVRPGPSWQAKAGLGFDATNFVVDWDNKVVTCPQGHKSTKWIPRSDVKGQAIINIRFLGSTCRACPVRSKCTKLSQPRLDIYNTSLELALRGRLPESQCFTLDVRCLECQRL